MTKTQCSCINSVVWIFVAAADNCEANEFVVVIFFPPKKWNNCWFTLVELVCFVLWECFSILKNCQVHWPFNECIFAFIKHIYFIRNFFIWSEHDYTHHVSSKNCLFFSFYLAALTKSCNWIVSKHGSPQFWRVSLWPVAIASYRFQFSLWTVPLRNPEHSLFCCFRLSLCGVCVLRVSVIPLIVPLFAFLLPSSRSAASSSPRSQIPS